MKIQNEKMRMVFLSVLWSLFSHAARTQSNENNVLARINSLHRSVFIDKNPDSLQYLLGKNLIYCHTDGYIESRDSLLSRISPDKGATYSEFAARTVALYFPNKKTAVVRQEVDARINMDDRVSRLQITLLMVWVNIKGQWMLELRQALKRDKSG